MPGQELLQRPGEVGVAGEEPRGQDGGHDHRWGWLERG